jgi:hypothetical protein
MSEYEGTLDRQQILAGWQAATQRGLELYGERRDFALDPHPMGLSWFMEFDHVIYSWGDGRHAQAVKGLWAPVAHQFQDEHGEWTEPELEGPNDNGWALMSGYSGQHQYRGPWMHESEYIGGRLAEDILNTCGFFVAIYPSTSSEVDEDTEPDTWAVAYISESIPGSA